MTRAAGRSASCATHLQTPFRSQLWLSFSLYLLAACHFSFVIKSQKSKAKNPPRDTLTTKETKAVLDKFLKQLDEYVPSTFELAQLATQLLQLPTENTRSFSF